MSSLFENYFSEHEGANRLRRVNYENFLAICDQIYKTKSKSIEQALLKLREWGANFGLPLLCIADSGTSFRNTFVRDSAKMGVNSLL